MFGVLGQHWDVRFLILGRPLTKARSVATLSFTEEGGGLVFLTLSIAFRFPLLPDEFKTRERGDKD